MTSVGMMRAMDAYPEFNPEKHIEKPTDFGWYKPKPPDISYPDDSFEYIKPNDFYQMAAEKIHLLADTIAPIKFEGINGNKTPFFENFTTASTSDIPPITMDSLKKVFDSIPPPPELPPSLRAKLNSFINRWIAWLDGRECWVEINMDSMRISLMVLINGNNRICGTIDIPQILMSEETYAMAENIAENMLSQGNTTYPE